MSTAEAKCPYCQHQLKDCFDYGRDNCLREGEELEDLECPNCLKVFTLVVEKIVATIRTYKQEA